ncbi:MAG: polymer-forming cytoskeletal protein [Brumimicrobium sp.]|nr:polymer-forming cytoskeletal protein [Brumimicrobium sp.]MCO5267960.1 polymer-forming cytoskeletal protein [Brumimicrobium sp.]
MFKGENKKNYSENPDKLNRLVSGTEIFGDISTASSLRIDGKIKGNVQCEGKLVLGEEGFIDGHITAIEVEINGTVTGNIESSTVLTLHKTANVYGNIITARLIIDDGAKLEGNIFTGEKKNAIPSPKKEVTKDIPIHEEIHEQIHEEVHSS